MAEEIQIKLRSIANKFRNKANLVVQEYGITRIEFEILNYMYVTELKQEKLKASDLAKCFEVSVPAIMHKLESLEKKSMIVKKRDTLDKRIKYYTLTEKTKSSYEELFAKQKKKVELYFETLGEEKEHLNRILDLTIKFLEELYD
ncbi:MAG: hypothetical protein K2N64_07500 [Anaeroplasmataceae bacterium]|nr:hypothetical protein [Anaeroplasmataceae bacterium]